MGLMAKKSVDTRVESVDVMVSRMQKRLSSALRQYERAQERVITTINKCRQDVQFQLGDEVVVRTAFLPSTAFKHTPTKIRQHYLGPFKVVKIISLVAYALELPSS